MVNACGSFAVYPPALLKDYMVPVPGLASGSASTFITNHLRMMAAAGNIQEYLEANLEQFLVAKKDDLVCPVSAKVPFILEYTACTAWLNQQTLYPQATLSELMDYNTYNGYGDFQPIADSDLLGCSITRAMYKGEVKLIAVLSYDRVMKTIVFRKSVHVVDTVEMLIRNILSICIHAATLNNILLAGGFAYSATNATIRATLANQYLEIFRLTTESGMSVVGRVVNDIAGQIKDALTGDESNTLEGDTLNGLADMVTHTILRAVHSDSLSQLEAESLVPTREELLSYYF